jgi:hypothetical protein
LRRRDAVVVRATGVLSGIGRVYPLAHLFAPKPLRIFAPDALGRAAPVTSCPGHKRTSDFRGSLKPFANQRMDTLPSMIEGILAQEDGGFGGIR